MNQLDDITETLEILKGLGDILKMHQDSADVQACIENLNSAIINLENYKNNPPEYIPISQRLPVYQRLWRRLFPED